MKKIQTLGLNFSRCFGDNIFKCVKDDVLFSHNFDWNLLNEEFSESNVEAPGIKCVIVATKLVLAPNIISRHAFKSLVFSPIFLINIITTMVIPNAIPNPSITLIANGSSMYITPHTPSLIIL